MPLASLREKYEQATDVRDIIFYGYLYQEKKCFAFDYNDLIVVVLYIFDQHPDIRLKWQKRLEYVMVDEFQDIDKLQYELMSVLVGYHKNLFVVGDSDQTIYTWRGADVRFLLDFDKVFPDTRTIMMLENYRSTPEVIAVANSLIEKNRQRIPKDLRACRTQHGPTVWHHAKTSDDEAKWIAEGVRALHDGGIRYRDMAVLYRAHYASRPVEEAFLKAEIPHAVYSGVPFYGRKEIKDSLAYLRLVAYQDDLSFMRVANVPKRNLGQRRMAFLKDYAEAHACSLFQALEQTIEDEIFKRTKAKQLVALVRKFCGSFEGRPVSEVLAALINESGYEQALRTEGSQERLDNVAELKQSIYEFENSCGEEVTLEHYLSHVALLTNADALDEAQDKVRLMTIHAAKGLEFPHVFLCSLSEGVLPVAQDENARGHGGGAQACVRRGDPSARRALSYRGGWFLARGFAAPPVALLARYRSARPAVFEQAERRGAILRAGSVYRKRQMDGRFGGRRALLAGRLRAPQGVWAGRHRTTRRGEACLHRAFRLA